MMNGHGLVDQDGRDRHARRRRDAGVRRQRWSKGLAGYSAATRRPGSRRDSACRRVRHCQGDCRCPAGGVASERARATWGMSGEWSATTP
jgi:hypothetical protein